VCPEVIRYSAPTPSPVKPDGTVVEMAYSVEEVSAKVETTRAAEDPETFSSMGPTGYTWAPDEGH
jgi:hypothetical protein